MKIMTQEKYDVYQAVKTIKTKEATTMTTIASIRRASDEITCEKCGEPLIAPQWAEFVSETLVLNLWSCTSCGYRFETEACVPADPEFKLDSKVLETLFPSLLVA
jgi:RNase P subunit RPR2